MYDVESIFRLVYIFALLLAARVRALVSAMNSAFQEEVPDQQIYIYIYIYICCVISVCMRTIINISLYILTVTAYNRLPNEDHCIEQMYNQKVFLKFCLSNWILQRWRRMSYKLTFRRSGQQQIPKSWGSHKCSF